MRLEELNLEGFGHFHQRTIAPMSERITVLYGPNEAGKSTLLAFIRAILFGFPPHFNNHYPPLAGGQHGGRIKLTSDAGLAYVVERFAGRRGGLSVVGPSGPASEAETVVRQLTGSATSDFFRTVFAFSLDELQDAASLQGASIYSAAQGAPGFPALKKSLSDRKGQIYVSKSSTKEVPKLLNTLRGIDEQLKAVESNAERYGRFTARQSAIDRGLKDLDAALSQLNARSGEIRSLLSGWDDWVALSDCEVRLRDMSRFEQFPEDPIVRLESLGERVQQAKEDLEDTVEQLQKASQAASAALPGENLLNDAGNIEGILLDRRRFDESVRDLPDRQAELREIEDALLDRLRALGDGWDESSLDLVDASMTAHDQLDKWNHRLTAVSSSAASAEVRLEPENARLQELRVEEQEAQNMLRAAPSGQDSGALHPASGRLEELLDDREQLERIRRDRGSFDASVRDLPERRAELGALESGLGERLRDLGQGWDEARVDNFDGSMVFRQEVDRWKETLAGRSDAVRQAQQRLEQEQAGLTERQAAAREAQERLPTRLPPPDEAALEQQRATLRDARSRLNEYELARSKHENLQDTLNSITGAPVSPDSAKPPRIVFVLAGLLGLAGIALIAAGLLQGDSVLLQGIIGGAVLLVAAVYLAVSRSAAPVTSSNTYAETVARQSAEAETAAESARALLVEAAQPLGITDDYSNASLDNAEIRLEATSRVFEAQRQVAAAVRLVEAQEQRVEAAARQSEAAAASDGEARQGWRDWARQRGLAESFAPDTMIEFMGRVETTRARMEQVRQMRQRVGAIQEDIDQYLALVAPVAAKYALALDRSDYQRIMAVADALIANFDNVLNLVNRRNDAARRLERQELAAATVAEAHRSATEVLSETLNQWHAWLRERRLLESFTPNTTLEFLARVETARTLREEVRSTRNRVAAIERDIDEFSAQVEPLAVRHGLPLDPEDRGQLARVADELISSLDQVQTSIVHRKQAKEQEEEIRGRLERQEQRLQLVQQELDALLATGGADGPEDFRLRARQHGERLELERQRAEHIRNLARLSGPGEKFDTFRESLADSDPNLLNEESRQLSERAEEVDTQSNELRKEWGGIGTELRQLIGEEESSALRIRRNTLLEQLREHAHEWSRLTIAELLLEKTRQKFEHERQPSVIRHAQGFFSNVTGQRYQRLYAPIGEQTITVMDSTGASKQPDALSRGTREQLYLALRFGLIREFGEHAERLPVVVDEALVNFDPERARLAAESFAVLSQTNQVLVFTCHPATRDAFKEAAGAQVLDISQPAS